MRSKKNIFDIKSHKLATTDADYNPNRPFYIVTAGKDRLIKVFDVRAISSPVRVLAGHSHFVTSVRYNRFHDQLILSGGTDTHVNLWRCSSISSAPLLEYEGDKPDTGDLKIRTYREHEESVYSVAWSACDAWVFASLDFTGRCAINQVPSTEKYKILL